MPSKNKRYNPDYWKPNPKKTKEYNIPYCPVCGWAMEIVERPESAVYSVAGPKRLWRCVIAKCRTTISFNG